MNQAERLFKATRNALDVLKSNDERKFTDPHMASLQRRICLSAVRSLRSAVGSTATDLDIDLVNDLLRIVKRLTSNTKRSRARFPDKIELALKMTEMAIGKSKETNPDHLLWMFHRFYNGVSNVIQIEEGNAATKGGL